MPFCRKCGHRLPEYSESCPDCKMSTTAPMINVRKITSSRASKAASSTNIAEAIIAVPEVTFTAKTTAPVAHQTQRQPPQQRQHSPVTDWIQPKVTILDKPAAAKPVLSAKHIVKPKKATTRKQTSPFTIVLNKPPATPKVARPRPTVTPKPVNSSNPVVEKPAASALVVSLVPPEPVALTEILPPPRLVPAAPVYPPHEIKQSNVSLKEDLLANPNDYDKQTFGFNLKCRNGHFWRAGRALPVSNDKAYCLQCGELLSKPKRFKQNRYHRY